MWTNKDFIDSKKEEMTIFPNGWVGPITVEFSLVRVGVCDPFKSLCFRVKGTNHTFAAFENLVTLNYHADYKEYFVKTLEVFRDYFIIWSKDSRFNDCEWKKEYDNEYKDKIILE